MTLQDKLDTLDGVRGAVEVSLKWIKNDFSDLNTVDDERLLETLVNPLKSALQATINYERKLKIHQNDQK